MARPGIKLVSTDQGVAKTEVLLGRDSARRPFQRLPWQPWKKRFRCECCGGFTLDSVDCCDICPECGWEDWYESHDAPDQVVRPNYISLNVARSLVQRFGVGAAASANGSHGIAVGDIERMSPDEIAKLPRMSEKCRLAQLRPPTADEQPRYDWRSSSGLVWVFNAAETAFPCGVWQTKTLAEKWIASVGASGTLSAYALDESAWDSNVRLGHLRLERPERSTLDFKRRFTTAVTHFHYEGGSQVG
ncbi:MAG: CPCC family cysteine-rich protein [Phycisphaerales bacterium]